MARERVTLTVGDRIAAYELRALIARGGMSTVFRAHDDRLDRDVALKVLPPDLSADPVFRARFEREWRILAGIRHPNIIPIFDAGEWDGQLYQAMLLVEGADLAQLVALAGPMELTRATSIITQVAAALDAAHALGVLHRDVKPGNVLLQPPGVPGGPEHVYLVDFGLTRRENSNTQLTRAGTVLGTVGYMAPEVLQGAPADARSDQYSLACVAYQLLVGEAPFRRSTQMGTIMATLQERPPSVRDHRGDIPPGVGEVVARGMAPAPEDRYPSSGAFAHDLEGAAAGHLPLPAPGRGADAQERHGRTARAEQSPRAPAPDQTETPRAPSPRRGRPALTIGVAAVLILVMGGLGALAAERFLAPPTATPSATVPGSAAAAPSATAIPGGSIPASTVAAAPTPASFDRLLSVIPAEIRDSCARNSSTEPSIVGYLVVIQCDLRTAQVVDVRYWLYPDPTGVDDQWARRMRALDAAGLPITPGNCWNGKPGQTTYALGSLQCDVYPSDGTLEVRWSNRRDLTYGAVNGSPGDLRALVQWWSDNAVLGGAQRTAP